MLTLQFHQFKRNKKLAAKKLISQLRIDQMIGEHGLKKNLNVTLATSR